MANILPISELTGDNFLRLSEICHTKDEPIFITKEGFGDLVLMSIEQYEQLKSQALSNVAREKMGYGPGSSGKNDLDMELEKLKSQGIEKIPLKDVADILKEKLDNQKINGPFNKKW